MENSIRARVVYGSDCGSDCWDEWQAVLVQQEGECYGCGRYLYLKHLSGCDNGIDYHYIDFRYFPRMELRDMVKTWVDSIYYDVRSVSFEC